MNKDQFRQTKTRLMNISSNIDQSASPLMDRVIEPNAMSRLGLHELKNLSGDLACDSNTTESNEKKDTAKKRRQRKKWKKPKDKPKRPLSAYNIFFKEERAFMLDDSMDDREKAKRRVHRKSHGKIGFAELACQIGQKWKSLPEDEKKVLKEKALTEKERYTVELAAWKEVQKSKEKETEVVEEESAIAGKVAEAEIVQQFPDESSSIAKETMTGGVDRDMLSVIQDNDHADLPTIGYLRSRQGRQGDISGLRSGDVDSLIYPGAVEALANTTMHQHRGIQFMGTAIDRMGSLPNSQIDTLSSLSAIYGSTPMSVADLVPSYAQLQLQQLQIRRLLMQDRLVAMNGILTTNGSPLGRSDQLEQYSWEFAVEAMRRRYREL
jgi:hypothetical protein